MPANVDAELVFANRDEHSSGNGSRQLPVWQAQSGDDVLARSVDLLALSMQQLKERNEQLMEKNALINHRGTTGREGRRDQRAWRLFQWKKSCKELWSEQQQRYAEGVGRYDTTAHTSISSSTRRTQPFVVGDVAF